MNRCTQSTICNIKTILPVDIVRAKVLDFWPDSVFVAATHKPVASGDVEHVHALVRWDGVTRWDRLASWLDTHDPHCYARPARSWRRSVRYLLHLDNPEKARVPRSCLVSQNIDEDDLDQLLGSAKMKILESLVAAQSLPLDQRFQFLVEERGHLPSEVSAALRCLIDLEKWAETRHGQYSALPASDREAVDDVFRGDWSEFDDGHFEGFEE